MAFMVGLVLGLFLGYGGAYLQHNPERRDELMALFKRKP